MNKPLVSVIIPSFNRFNYLLDSIDSVLSQDYENLEIIIINDGSDEEKYYSQKFDGPVKIVHLKENQKKLNGFGPGAIRNFGTEKAQGKYLAFLDDDDIWLESKLKLQISFLEKTEHKMSSTEGYFGIGRYEKTQKYPLYNKEFYIKDLKYKYRKTKYIKKNRLPEIWDKEFISIHNCAITSSVVVERDLFIRIGGFRALPLWADYDCWKSLSQFTDSIYIDQPLVYYDSGHGDGRNYEK
ncbi:glycosyltransferase [Candidatus Actinomarina]|jgi:glycosyltransferase involved in cell wall biosynthesis|nr:glycosyltransferase [Candidatus Actinomarina sp.]